MSLEKSYKFLTTSIAWGRRDLILRSSRLMLELMDNSPYQFIMSANENEFLRFFAVMRFKTVLLIMIHRNPEEIICSFYKKD